MFLLSLYEVVVEVPMSSLRPRSSEYRQIWKNEAPSVASHETVIREVEVPSVAETVCGAGNARQPGSEALHGLVPAANLARRK